MRHPLPSDQVRKRKHKSKHAEIMAEWAELAKEEQMARRMRKGKMTEVRGSFFCHHARHAWRSQPHCLSRQAEFDKQAYVEDEDIQMLLDFDRRKEEEAAEAQRAAAEEAARAAMEAASAGSHRRKRVVAKKTAEPAAQQAASAEGGGEAVQAAGGAGTDVADAAVDTPQKKRKRKRKRKKKADSDAAPNGAGADASGGTKAPGTPAGSRSGKGSGKGGGAEAGSARPSKRARAKDTPAVPSTVWARFSRPQAP